VPGMEGKVAVLTGGNSGIGFAIAREFVEQGASVVITGRRQAQLDEAVAAIGPNCSAFRADVSSSADMDDLFAEVMSRHGRLNAVVANAASGHHSVLGSITDEEFDLTFNINVKGVLHSVQKALPLLTSGGVITIIGSTAPIHPPYGMGLYGGAKAAIRNFLEAGSRTPRGRASG
jgi:NAD(P)-dependent dehydrogenase (short-subunit alcohol dehydrogenase family)